MIVAFNPVALPGSLRFLGTLTAPDGSASAVQPPPIPASVQPLVDEAKRLMDAGRALEATASLEQYLGGLPAGAKMEERRAVGWTLALCYRALAEKAEKNFRWSQAVIWYEKTYELCKDLLPLLAAVALNQMGLCHAAQSSNEKALECFDRARTLSRQQGFQREEASALNNMSTIYSRTGSYKQAVDCLQQALPYFRETGDKKAQATILSNLGWAYVALTELSDALKSLNEAYTLFEQLGDGPGKAATLQTIASVHAYVSDFETALSYLNRALAELKGNSNPRQRAVVLSNVGVILRMLTSYGPALDALQESLSLLRSVGDRSNVAVVLVNIGLCHFAVGNLNQALEDLKEAQALQKAIGPDAGEAVTLGSIGLVLQATGDHAQALAVYEEALSLLSRNGDRRNQAVMLNNIGAAHLDLKNTGQALKSLEQALALARSTGDRRLEASTLGNLGRLYLATANPRQSVVVNNQACEIFRAVGDKRYQASTTNNLGLAYTVMTDFSSARAFFAESLCLSESVGDTLGAGASFSNLCDLYADTRNPERHLEFAIWHGKTAINAFQATRRDVEGWGFVTLQQFLFTKVNTYRATADLLMKSRRYAEAEEVLTVLKGDELDQVLRPPTVQRVSLLPVTLTIREQRATGLYKTSVSLLSRLEAEHTVLSRKRRLGGGKFTNPNDETRLADIDRQVTNARGGFLSCLTREAAAQFRQNGGAGEKDGRVDDVPLVVAFRQCLRRMNETGRDGQTVAVLVLTAGEHCHTLLVTPERTTAHSTPVKSADLDKLVARFLTALRTPPTGSSPGLDPRPAGRELYDLLIKPLEADLKKSDAQTVLFSLDGSLRYVPVAALFDGKQYVAQKWRTALFSPTLTDNLAADPRPGGKVLAVGVTREATVGTDRFAALPGVAQEVRAVASQPGDRALLDAQFTREALARGIADGYATVHVASHFKLGLNRTSYLLLGEGKTLPLSDVAGQGFFKGVDLLVLSACDTARGTLDNNGAEVEGFGALAQMGGAKAVLATLWPVADASTSLLMQTFYRRRASDPRAGKADTLRKSQLSLLSGEIKGPVGGPVKGVDPGISAAVPKDAARYPLDPKKPYAHPYHWAGFVLIGNTR